MTNLGSSKSYKIWSSDRGIKKSVIANDLNDLKSKGAKKLGYNIDQLSQFRVVLEADGTEIEDDQYFQTMTHDTIFILLKDQEKWLPPGVEEIKSAIAGFPGNVTILLQLDKKTLLEIGLEKNDCWRLELVSKSSNQNIKITSANLKSNYQNSKNAFSNDGDTADHSNLNELKEKPFFAIYKSSSSEKIKLKKNGDVDDDEENALFKKSREMFSPNHNYDHDHSKCDFHCSSLHREGAQINMDKNTPLLLFHEGLKEFEIISDLQQTNWPISSTKGRVRFLESENLNLINDEEIDEGFSDCYLLLVDELSIKNHRHLSIKDIGTILEHFNSKIVEVDCLKLEKESQDYYKWIIKAKIKGETLKNIKVIYNGHYYEIMEQPKWAAEKYISSTFL